MPSLFEITPSQLSRLIGTPKAPIILDLRMDEDFALDPNTIPGARRVTFVKVQNLAPQLHDHKVVIYCQKGRKISHGAAAVLRARGIHTEVLSGGHFAWRDAGLPLLETHNFDFLTTGKSSVWVTRQRPKVDRIACPWLIRRFIDTQAQFLFVPADDVLLVAEKFNAIAFDVEQAFWCHRDYKCTFDALLNQISVAPPALKHIARIIRAADTDDLQLEAEAKGLLAISLGLSRMYRDDNVQLESSLVIYDALYRWARDASGETHLHSNT